MTPRARGVRFGNPVRLARGAAHLVYRVRHSEEIAFANVIDTIDATSAGG